MVRHFKILLQSRSRCKKLWKYIDPISTRPVVQFTFPLYESGSARWQTVRRVRQNRHVSSRTAQLPWRSFGPHTVRVWLRRKTDHMCPYIHGWFAAVTGQTSHVSLYCRRSGPDVFVEQKPKTVSIRPSWTDRFIIWTERILQIKRLWTLKSDIFGSYPSTEKTNRGKIR